MMKLNNNNNNKTTKNNNKINLSVSVWTFTTKSKRMGLLSSVCALRPFNLFFVF
jgi:hypothetical protein